MRASLLLTLLTVCVGFGAPALDETAKTDDAAIEEWKELLGKPAPALVAAAWEGTPVSLEAVRGNVVLLGFWNSDAGG
jgi:hypothetical protein